MLNLRRKFLSAIPVISPHSPIEAELLLAGKKPMGSFLVVAPEHLSSLKKRDEHWNLCKTILDLQRLDDAVLSGQLISCDHGYRERLYAQPEFSETIKAFAKRENCTERGRDFGYRRRDTLFFDWDPKTKFEKAVKDYMQQKREPILQALHSKLLIECGITNPDEYLALTQNQLEEISNAIPD